MSILISIFILGYHGKTTDFAKNSSCHRTTIAHFLNSGKWDDSLLSDTLKCSVIEIIYSEAARTGKPVFCIVDDTIASKTKPSSRALHPIEDAYFHQSHLKGKQDYGHQAVAVMLSCNGIVLNYAFVMYNKSISKIDIVQSIAKELPVPPVMSYFLCDCWYVSEKIINTFAQRGFHTIGALKTNRLLYPSGMKKKLRELAAELSVTHREFDLVTVKKRNYYVYRYEGNLNGIENAVVLLSYPEKAFGNPKALRAFISTNVALSTQEILSWYVCRWPIEVFFRQCKEKLALDGYQIRSAQGIKRYWLLMSLAHFMCAVGTGRFCSFETGYHEICDTIQLEKYRYLFQCAKESNDFDSFMKFACVVLCNFSNLLIYRYMNENGASVGTEALGDFNQLINFVHWNTDMYYSTGGGQSEVLKFVTHGVGDLAAPDRALLGALMPGVADWRNVNDFNEGERVFYRNNLPTKYLQHFDLLKWDVNKEAMFSDNVKTKVEGDYTLVYKDEKLLAKINTSNLKAYHEQSGNPVAPKSAEIFIPWSPEVEDKIYCYNDVNGTSTWSVPNSWEDVTTAQLYQLTENGRSYVGEVAVQNGQVTLQLDLSIPYILVKEKAAQAHRYNADGSVMKKDGATVMLPTSEEHPWGYGSAIENFGFSGKTFDGWEKTVTEGTKEQITMTQLLQAQKEMLV